MHRRVWLSTLGFLLLFSPAALAQPRDSAAADRLFKEGRAAFDKGDYATACPRFADSQKADPAPGTLLNLALCEEKLGKVASARGHVVELLAQLEVKDERHPIAKELFNKLDARVVRFMVTLAPGAPPNTLVRLTQGSDSRPLGFGSEVFLDAGNYRLEISAPGRPDSHTDITLSEGQRESKSIAPAAEGEKVQEGPKTGTGGAGGGVVGDHPEVPTPPSSAPLRRTIGFIAGGIGVASFIAAGVTGGILVGKKNKLDKLCPGMPHVCMGNEWKSVQDSAKAILPINTATFIIGIAGVGAGAVLILTSLGGGGDKKEPPKEPAVTPAGFVLPGGGAVSLSGRF